MPEETSKPIALEPVPVRRMETHPFRLSLFEAIQSVLQAHGVTVERSEEHCVMTFPEGTSKSELLPRIHNPQYEVHLPDGYAFYETTNTHGNLSIVRFRLEGFSEEVQEQILREQTL